MRRFIPQLGGAGVHRRGVQLLLMPPCEGSNRQQENVALQWEHAGIYLTEPVPKRRLCRLRDTVTYLYLSVHPVPDSDLNCLVGL